eukprot:237123_1
MNDQDHKQSDIFDEANYECTKDEISFDSNPSKNIVRKLFPCNYTRIETRQHYGREFYCICVVIKSGNHQILGVKSLLDWSFNQINNARFLELIQNLYLPPKEIKDKSRKYIQGRLNYFGVDTTIPDHRCELQEFMELIDENLIRNPQLLRLIGMGANDKIYIEYNQSYKKWRYEMVGAGAIGVRQATPNTYNVLNAIRTHRTMADTWPEIKWDEATWNRQRIEKFGSKIYIESDHEIQGIVFDEKNQAKRKEMVGGRRLRNSEIILIQKTFGKGKRRNGNPNAKEMEKLRINNEEVVNEFYERFKGRINDAEQEMKECAGRIWTTFDAAFSSTKSKMGIVAEAECVNYLAAEMQMKKDEIRR